MNRKNDFDFKRAALLIAKLLLRTREGKIQWRADHSPEKSIESFSARMEGDLNATITRNSKQLSFRLSELASVERIEAGLQAFKQGNEIDIVAIDHSKGKADEFTLEAIVYRDLEELIQLASDPRSASEDIRFKQAMSYLDKLAV